MESIIADLILYNTNIITMNQKCPTAQLVAIRDGKIVMVGTDDDLELVRGQKTRVINCEGKTVVPGFNDAHTHILALASSLLSVDCSPSSVTTIAEIQAKIRQRVKKTPRGSWIRANHYNEFYLADKRHPTRWDLDQAAPYHPVRLMHRSMHACVLNSLGLSLAGISNETPEPPGGFIDRDETGEPTGLLFELNAYLEQKQIPPTLTGEELKQGIRLANLQFLSSGITSLQDATRSNGLPQWQTLKRLILGGDLLPRVCMMTGINKIADFREQGLLPGSGNVALRLGAAKIVLDETTGSLHPSPSQLNEEVLSAHRAGFQVAIHAIGETQLEAAVSALEYVLNLAPRPDHRHRIEHCSVCPPRLLPRLKNLQAVVVTQPAFIYYSGERYLDQVPRPESKWLYRARSFLENSVRLAASSDSPVVPTNLLVGIYAAVTRKAETGEVVLAEEAVSPIQALGMYTLGAAYASFEENVKGSIEVGKLADLVVLSSDPTRVPVDEIKDIEVEKTFIGGTLAWGKGRDL